VASLGILSLLILTHIADRTIESLLQVAVQDVWFWRISQLLIGASVAYRYLGCPVLAHIAVQKRRRVACRSYCDVRQNSISQFGREGALHVAAIAMCVKTVYRSSKEKVRCMLQLLRCASKQGCYEMWRERLSFLWTLAFFLPFPLFIVPVAQSISGCFAYRRYE